VISASGRQHHVYIARDLSRREHDEHLETAANRDPVTGLWNRRHFARDLQVRIAASLRYHTQGSLLLVALDDTPHAATRADFDRLAQLVAEALRTSVRDSDIVARTSHAHFGVLLDHTGMQGAEQCAEKILRVLHAITLPEHEATIISAAVGIAVFPDCARTPEHALESAGSALAVAQRRRSDRVSVFVPVPLQPADPSN
jgi:diguanylate cyclase (GGDEF)-like protein